MMKIKYFIGLILSTIILSSCGGGASGGGNSTATKPTPTPNIPDAPEVITAQFIDAPVKGLHYVRSDKSEGVTGNAGELTCLEGEMIEFFIAKNAPIGSAVCNEKIFPQHLDLLKNDENLMHGIIAVLLKLNNSISPETEIDLSGNNVLSDPVSITSHIVNANLGNDFSILALNEILNEIKGSTGDFSLTNYNSLLTQAQAHLENSMNVFSDIKQSERVAPKTLTNWLEEKTKLAPTKINLDSQVVYQTVKEGAESSLCPAGDLSGLGLVLSASGATEVPASSARRYFISVTNSNATMGKTEILSSRATTKFQHTFGSNLWIGSASVMINHDLSGGRGLIQFDIKNSGKSIAHCEYRLIL